MIIGICPNIQRDINGEATKKILNSLSKFDCNVLLQSKYKNIFGNELNYTDNIYADSDVLIAVGGDATIMQTAKKASYFEKPVLGVNLGKVGYMAALEMDELSLLENLISGNYTIEERMLLKAIAPDLSEHYCLNDLVVKNIASAGLADISLYNGDTQVLSYRADGVIVSTPTGSTAYSLSAGGPITEPVVDCFIITPICAHSTVARSVVLSANSSFSIKIENEQKLNVCAVFDGRDEIKLNLLDSVKFEKSNSNVARLIKIKNQSFYDVLKLKLNNV